MSKEVTYNVNNVINSLGLKIANLEVQLAHAQAVNDAYAKKLQELEEKKEKPKENQEK